MVAIAWKTATSGNWSANGNWNPAGPPTGDDLTIGVAGSSYTSTIDQSYMINTLFVNSASATVVEAAGVSLNVTGAGVEVLAGVLNLSNANTISGSVFAFGGELDLGNAGAIGAAALDIRTGGYVRGTATETLSNTLFINQVGSTQTIAAAHGTTLTLASTSASYAGGGNSLLKFGAVGSDGTVSVQFTASPTVTATNAIQVVAGTLTGSGNGFSGLVSQVASVTIDAGAALEVNGASLNFKNLLGGGSLTNSGGATLAGLSAGNFSGVISGSLSLGINGNVTLSGANSYYGLTSLAGGVTTITNGSALSAGPILFNGGALFTTANMTLANNAVIGTGTPVTIAAATGTSLNLTGTIKFTGQNQSIILGNPIDAGAITFGASGGIAGFGLNDLIDFGTINYVAGEHMALIGISNGIETFALENLANTILSTVNLDGYYSVNDLSVANDGFGHAVVSYVGGTTLVPPTVTEAFFHVPYSGTVLQSGANVVGWLNEFGVNVVSQPLTGLPAGAVIVGAGDFNADGLADVLMMNGGVLSEGDINTGAFAGINSLGSAGGFTVGGVGDFNGDGTSDVLLQSGGTFVDYTVKNGAVTGGAAIGTAAGWTVGGVGDFNGDGTSDIVLQNNGSFTIWDMHNGLLTQGFALTPLPGWSVVGTGDFNGDGTSDILLQSGGTLVAYMIHNNAVEFGNLLSSSLSGWSVVGTGDYDGDGTSDILLQAGNTVVDYTMHGGAVASGAVFGNTGGLQIVGK